MRHLLFCLAFAALLGGCATPEAPPEPLPAVLDVSNAPPGQARPCPAEVPAGTRCFSGEDGLGG